MPGRGTSTLQRQWRLVNALAGLQRGRTIAQLRETVGIRATVYRYVDALRDAGVPIKVRYETFGAAPDHE